VVALLNETPGGASSTMRRTMRRPYRRYSIKRRALGEAFGRPWDEVALEYDRREMSLADIGAEWQRRTGQVFSAKTVRRIINYAQERARQRSASSDSSERGDRGERPPQGPEPPEGHA
jgi:hypothetical protein